MFRRSSKSSQLNFFSSVESLLKGRSLKDYEDAEKWHNQFRIQVANRIDEDIFRPLFYDGFGAPNASIRILVGMMILKEARGWSDSQLFENCRYNLLVHSALGLLNIDDTVSVLPKQEISASSIQSPHDTDCQYRQKDNIKKPIIVWVVPPLARQLIVVILFSKFFMHQTIHFGMFPKES